MAAIAVAYAQPYVVNTIAGKGKLPYAGDGKAATSVNFFSPNRVAFDSAGNLYFTESYYHRVFKVDTAGTLTAVAGNGNDVFAGEGGLATDAAVPYPEGIAVDAAGNLYVGTSYRLCKISGGKLRTKAGTGDPGYTGDGSPALSATIHTPAGIAIDGHAGLLRGGTRHILAAQHARGAGARFQGQPLHRRPLQQPDPQGHAWWRHVHLRRHR